MRGLDPRIHHLRETFSDGLPGIRAFTPVFDGLCPAMTRYVFLHTSRDLNVPSRSIFFSRISVATIAVALSNANEPV